MYQKISTTGMSRSSWLELRKTGIGGSDAGAVCGVNPYSSPLKVFWEKTGDITEEQNSEILRQGRDLEQYVADRFCEATGRRVRRSNYLYRSMTYPWMIADIDRLVVGEEAGLECKTVSAYSADKWKNGCIPIHYALQCFHYMTVTGKKSWYIAAVILGKEFVYHKLEWDDAVINRLIEIEKEFWIQNVIAGVMPEPDGSAACDDLLGRTFSSATKSDAIELVGFDEKLDRRSEILDQISALQQEQRKIEQEVKLYMAEHELAVSKKYQVSWGNVDTTRLDTKRIRKEQPELYRDYASVTTSRRFVVQVA